MREERNKNNHSKRNSVSDIAIFVGTFFDCLCRDIFEMITDMRTIENVHRGLDSAR